MGAGWCGLLAAHTSEAGSVVIAGLSCRVPGDPQQPLPVQLHSRHQRGGVQPPAERGAATSRLGVEPPASRRRSHQQAVGAAAVKQQHTQPPTQSPGAVLHHQQVQAARAAPTSANRLNLRVWLR